MTIYGQSGNSFSIRGSGWSGTGQINGNSGFYDWRFTNGKSGRTTFTVRSDGTIDGHVEGPAGDKGLNWAYVARPTAHAQTACVSPGGTRKKDDGFIYWTFSNSCDADRMVTVCAEYTNGNHNILSVNVPAQSSADINLGLSTSPAAKLSWKEGGGIRCPNR
jgi:hypothetical protein